MILVNGMVKSFYCDTVDGQRPVESVIIKDLIPHVDQTYRTIARREGRVIEGYSMGGYGAGHLGFKYPELFGTVVVNAGALMDPDVRRVPQDGPMYGVFGDDRERRMAEHPEHLARKNADKLRGQTHIRIGCGTADILLPRNQSLDKLLTQLKIEHEYEEVPGVAHSWVAYYKKLGAQGLGVPSEVLRVARRRQVAAPHVTRYGLAGRTGPFLGDRRRIARINCWPTTWPVPVYMDRVPRLMAIAAGDSSRPGPSAAGGAFPVACGNLPSPSASPRSRSLRPSRRPADRSCTARWA